jgi:hypothetical protein
MNKLILYIALVVSIATYLLWQFMPKGYFYIGNAITILMLCTYLFYNDKKSFVKFCFFQLSLSNLIQEICNSNTKLEFSELLLILIVPFVWYIRNVLKND